MGDEVSTTTPSGTSAQPSFDRLVALLRNEALKQRVAGLIGCVAALGIGTYLVILTVVILVRSYGHSHPAFPEHMEFLFNLLLVAAGLGAATSKRAKRAARELLEFDDVRAIGPLAEMFHTQDQELRGAIRPVLLRLLPMATSTLKTEISREQAHSLARAITGEDMDLSIAIIHGLGRFGTGTSLPDIRAIAEWQETFGNQKVLQRAAQEVLPALEQAARDEALRMSLLRPSSSPDAPEQVLLRPVGPYTTVDETQLLRPAQPD